MTPTSRVEQHGFTLLELLVVLSIIVLGVGLLAPGIGLTDNSAFNAEVRNAASTLSYARRMAIVQGTPVTVAVDEQPVTFYPQGGSTGATLRFAHNARRAVVDVNPVTGRIRVAWGDEEDLDEF